MSMSLKYYHLLTLGYLYSEMQDLLFNSDFTVISQVHIKQMRNNLDETD